MNEIEASIKFKEIANGVADTARIAMDDIDECIRAAENRKGSKLTEEEYQKEWVRALFWPKRTWDEIARSKPKDYEGVKR